MPLLHDLLETYENFQGHEPDNMEKIAPVGFHYKSLNNELTATVTIDDRGQWVGARVEKKKKCPPVLVAMTEDSVSRTSNAKESPNALSDKLLFMTPRYSETHKKYMEQLEEWCTSSFSCWQIQAVLQYLKHHDLLEDLKEDETVKDLLEDESIPADEKKKKKKEKKLQDLFVLWRVVRKDSLETQDTWKNETIQKSWMRYYSEHHYFEYHNRGNRRTKTPIGLDGITGEEETDLETLHPSPIMAYGRSKLISTANEEDKILHFKGERFTDESQVLQIGYQSSQKIHNALTWLVDTQSIAISKNSRLQEDSTEEEPGKDGTEKEPEKGSMKKESGGSTKEKPKYLVCWSPERNMKMDMYSQMAMLMGVRSSGSTQQYESYRDRMKRILYGLEDQDLIKRPVSIFMTGRSGDGRFSPVLYRSYHAHEFLDKLRNWYSDFTWYFWDSKEKRLKIDSPSIFKIVRCAYGTERLAGNKPYLDVDDRVLKDAVNTLLMAVLDGRQVPDSLIRRFTLQASSPERFAGNKAYKWKNWREILAVACAAVHYRHMKRMPEKGEEDLKLDEENEDRSYLFGRLLAVVDKIENTALNRRAARTGDSDKDRRDTNAMRLWSAYAAHPFTCFANLRQCVQPYLSMLSYGGRKYYEDEIQTIISRLTLQDKNLNRPLEPEYLLGFYLEREKLNTYKADDTPERDDDTPEEETKTPELTADDMNERKENK